jgi:hypothetical protein
MRLVAGTSAYLDLLIDRYNAEILCGKQPVLDHPLLLVPDLTRGAAKQIATTLTAFLYRCGRDGEFEAKARFISRGSGWGVYVGPAAKNAPHAPSCARPGTRRP